MTKLFGLGNPLLDCSAEVEQNFLDKYTLNLDDVILEGPAQAGLFEAMANLPGVQYIPGGATQNTTRVFSGLSGKRGHASFSGCVGDDEIASRMTELCQAANVDVKYCVTPGTLTGVCCCAISGNHRSLCSRVGAASYYQANFIEDQASELLQSSDIVYSAGFFLLTCPAAMLYAARHCAENNKIFATNLSAPFVVDCESENLLKVIPFADFVFGNLVEWEALSAKIGCKEVKEAALKVAAMSKVNPRRPRYVVVTRGAEPSIVVFQDHSCEGSTPEVSEHAVVLVSDSDIVDTNAAGDAFVGGFLYGISPLGGGQLSKAIQFGNYAANKVIRSSGCTFDFTDRPKAV